MKLISLLLLLTSMLVACAKVYITPPEDKKIEKSKIFTSSYEKTWTRAVDWFAEHNVAIDKIEKTSGLLIAKYLLKASESNIDCGKIDTAGFMGSPEIKRYVAINITVREVDSNTTKVNVNSFGEFSLSGRDVWDGSIKTADGKCNSTGDIETSILNFIGKQ